MVCDMVQSPQLRWLLHWDGSSNGPQRWTCGPTGAWEQQPHREVERPSYVVWEGPTVTGVSCREAGVAVGTLVATG